MLLVGLDVVAGVVALYFVQVMHGLREEGSLCEQRKPWSGGNLSAPAVE